MKRRNYMTRSITSARIVSATILVLIAVSFAYAAQKLTPAQETAWKKCLKGNRLCIALCNAQYPPNSVGSAAAEAACEDRCDTDFTSCCDKAGIPRTMSGKSRSSDLTTVRPGQTQPTKSASPVRTHKLPTDLQATTTVVSPTATPKQIRDQTQRKKASPTPSSSPR
jgi:hypothetical protein